MNIARPTNDDIDAAFDLISAIKTISFGLNPHRKDADGEPEELHDDDRGEALEHVLELYDRCNIDFLLIALGAVIDPKNGIIDQDSSILELSPDLVKSQQDTDMLDWLITNGARIEDNGGNISFYASIDDDSIDHSLIGIRKTIEGKMQAWCKTMNRQKKSCGCPDCGSSLVQIGEQTE